MRLKIGTWNLNHWQRSAEQRAATWNRARGLGVDILLVQEAIVPNDLDHIYAGDISKTRRWGTGIVNFNPKLTLKEIPTRSLGSGEEPDAAFHDGVLEVSQPGLVAVGEVSSEGFEPLTAVSAYGLNADKVLNGIRYTTTVVHRILSDVMPLIDTYRGSRRVVFGGDLNISPQIGHPDTRAHEIVIERLEASGMIDCLGKFHGDFVQTHKTNNSERLWQDDWIFVSRQLEPLLLWCDSFHDEQIWEFSDHCPVVAELDWNSIQRSQPA